MPNPAVILTGVWSLTPIFCWGPAPNFSGIAPAPDFAKAFARQDSGMARATRGLADLFVMRADETKPDACRLANPAHAGELLFGFLLEGSAVLECEGIHALADADAFVIPAGKAWTLNDCSPDLRLMQVIVPAAADGMT